MGVNSRTLWVQQGQGLTPCPLLRCTRSTRRALNSHLLHLELHHHNPVVGSALDETLVSVR